MTQFFDQWIHGTSYPHLKGTYTSASTSSPKLQLEQTQNAKKTANKTFFAFNIDVVAFVGSRTSSALRCIKETVVFDGSKASVSVSFALKRGESIYQLYVDPDMKVLHSLDFNPGLEILSNTALSLSSPVSMRIWAGKGLAQMASMASLSVLEKAMKSEEFFGVRVEVAKALSGAKTQESLQLVAHMLDAETDPMAMAGMLQDGELHLFLRFCIVYILQSVLWSHTVILHIISTDVYAYIYLSIYLYVCKYNSDIRLSMNAQTDRYCSSVRLLSLWCVERRTSLLHPR